MHIVMKVTKACNLRCAYCYVDHDSADFMSVALVRTTIEKFGKHFKEIAFLWHGGEPLLAGIDFYQQVIEEQRRYTATYGVTFENQIQTNGTLLDDEWIQFFIKNRFIFGISYDGPNEANGYRVDQNGQPVDTDFKSLFLKLKEEYQQSTGVLSVVNGLNITKPEVLYSYYKELKIDTINFSPYLGGRDAVDKITPDDFFFFYKSIFDLWFHDPAPFNVIAIICDIIHNLFNVVYRQGCTWSGTCFRSNLAILPNGNIFPCLTLKDPDHCIGNILEGSPDDILKNSNYIQTYLAQKAVIQECAPCEYFDICKGGCRTASLRMLGRLGEKDPFCEGRKKLIKHIFINIYSDITGFSERKINELWNENEGFLRLRTDMIDRIATLDPNRVTSLALARVIAFYQQKVTRAKQVVNV